TYTAKVSGRSITFGCIGSVSETSTMTTSGAAENGSETLRQPLANVHRRANTVEDEAGMAEFQTAMMLPSWANVADTYWADAATYFPKGSRITSWLPGIPRLLFPTAESVATSKTLVGADPNGETRSKLTIVIANERNADRPMLRAIVASQRLEARDDT